MFHIHQYVESRDCDGTIQTSQTYDLTDEYPDEDSLLEQLVGWALPLWGTQRIEIHVVPIRPEDDEEPETRVTISHQTEEGYRTVELVTCREGCQPESTYRDLTAERAGY